MDIDVDVYLSLRLLSQSRFMTPSLEINVSMAGLWDKLLPFMKRGAWGVGVENQMHFQKKQKSLAVEK